MLIEKLKATQLQARKDKDRFTATILSTLIGEIDMVGKNDGNRASTDDEAIKVITKFKKGALEVLNVESDEGKCREVNSEIAIYDSFLPKLMNERETQVAVEVMVKNMTNPNMGQVMGAMKKEYGNSLDMAIASKIVKSVLS